MKTLLVLLGMLLIALSLFVQLIVDHHNFINDVILPLIPQMGGFSLILLATINRKRR